MDKTLNMALVGASGVVGKKILQLLEKKGIKVDKLFPLGSSTVGQTVHFQNQDYVIGSLDDFDPTDANITIFSAGGSVAKQYARKFVEAGNYVIDLSSRFRYEKDIPLIIPEINGNEINLLDAPSIISNPNCSTSQLLMAIAPIHKEYEIDVLNIATYQAVSGTGKQAVQELKNQITDESINQEVYPKKIAFNVIPQCDIFLDNDFTKEEMKLVWETKKILDNNIEVQATCVRVPVINGHSEAVFLRTKKETSREQIIELLNNSSGIKVIDNPKSQEYPTPLENANDTEEVFVGRIRSQTINNENWISMWIVADNVYGKGAALNTVQILESLVENKKLC